jgi:4-amino-4-deoxy-L-arabinose transferase-like glycosyltransferase
MIGLASFFKEETGVLGKSFLYLGTFLFIHTICWTLGPYLARPSLPHDTLESITWGLQWQLGYSKHPFLTAWLCAGVFELFHSDWSIYLLAQLLILITFLAVWQLAKQFLPLKQALIATLILDGVLFYNINSFNLTPDTLQSPLWVLLSLFFYYALTTEKLHYWLLTGVFAALCLCTKYQAALLIGSILFFCLINPIARSHFKKPGIYYSLGCFMLLMSPHLIWLYQHHFMSLFYVQSLSVEYASHKTLFSHLVYPLSLLANGFFSILGSFILLWPFYNKGQAPFRITSFQWQFLIILGFGPLVLSIMLCMVSGDYFPSRWLTPYFFLISISTVGYIKPVITRQNLKKFMMSLIFFSSLIFLTRMLSLTLFVKAENDAFLPNQKMASSLSTLWHEYSHTPLSYIAGSNYLTSLLVPYLPDNPQPYLSWHVKENPWINEIDLRKKGALFIWDDEYNYAWDEDSRHCAHLPKIVMHRFPELIIMPPSIFYRMSNKKPIVIGVAILPPSQDPT